VPAATGLSALWKEGNLNQEEDDQVAREVVGRVYQAGNQKAHIQALNDVSAAKLTRQLADRRTALSVIQQFKLTRQAQIFAMGVAGLTGGFSQGHAVTVYAYDGDKQQFLYYDNNFPGEVVSVPWNWTDGFGKTSKNQGFDIFAFASFNSAYSSNFLNSVYQAAQNGFNSSFYPKISISTPVATLTNPNTMEVADENNVVIEGTVPRPSSAQNPNAQRYAHIYINGTWVAAADLDQVSNRFRYTLTKLPNLAGTDVMILVSENKRTGLAASTLSVSSKSRSRISFSSRIWALKPVTLTHGLQPAAPGLIRRKSIPQIRVLWSAASAMTRLLPTYRFRCSENMLPVLIMKITISTSVH
jgi:hypothetical protein